MSSSASCLQSTASPLQQGSGSGSTAAPASILGPLSSAQWEEEWRAEGLVLTVAEQGLGEGAAIEPKEIRRLG